MQVSWNKPTAGVVCTQDPGGGAERQVLTSSCQDSIFPL